MPPKKRKRIKSLDSDEEDEKPKRRKRVKKEKAVAPPSKKEEEKVPPPLPKKEEKTAVCPICNKTQLESDLVSHVEQCFSTTQTEQKKPAPPKEETKASFSHSDEVVATCLARENQSPNVVDDTQMKALMYIQDNSKVLAEKSRKELEEKFVKLGYSADTVDKVIRYICYEAPIIIHFNCDKVMSFFVKDTHYRNQFETNTTNGAQLSQRRPWETRIYNGIYDKAAPFARCKYGVLNLLNDPRGISTCKHYGDSYFCLKNETVRLRSTFSSADSCHEHVVLTTCENYTYCLNQFTDNEIKDVTEIALKKELALVNTHNPKECFYKEVQIHGPVRLNMDIECVFINPRHKNDPEMMKLVDQFVSKNQLNMVFIE